MTYRLPSLNGLRAFEAAARHLSIKHAAVELCVTAGAVSQQIKALEGSLGVELFTRSSRGIALTATGEAYLESVSEAFDLLSGATDNISVSLKGRKFRLGISSTLGQDFDKQIELLRNSEDNGFVAEMIDANDFDSLYRGSLDALLRSRIKSHPELHLDQLQFINAAGKTDTVTLALMPGNKGCRGHQLLLQRLARISET